MARKLIAGNWKMNGLQVSGRVLIEGLLAKSAENPGLKCDLLVCPPTTLLGSSADRLAGKAVALGAQDCHWEKSGAHTGDISAEMLKDIGCSYVIVGHSERRADHGESNAQVKVKAAAAQGAGLVPIVCVGETLEERDAGKALAVIEQQVRQSVPDGLPFVLAYEPVWAIGTGRTPTLADIGEVHALIRNLLKEVIGAGADEIRILYGGSVKPANAAEILAVANVDGALVGGASLKAEDFWQIAVAGA
jgi:triosephosphate isomerase